MLIITGVTWSIIILDLNIIIYSPLKVINISEPTAFLFFLLFDILYFFKKILRLKTLGRFSREILDSKFIHISFIVLMNSIYN